MVRPATPNNNWHALFWEALEFKTTPEAVSKDAPLQRDLSVDEKYFKRAMLKFTGSSQVHINCVSRFEPVTQVAVNFTDGSAFVYFRLALTQAHSRLHDQVLLDVGSGTGILSIFGARAGAKHVYAVDAAKRTCELAEKIIAENGLTSSITVINSQVEDAQLSRLDRVGAIVSEWMGYCLLYENMLTSVLLARDKYLRPTSDISVDDLAAWRRLRLFPCTASLFAAAFTETSPEMDGIADNSGELDNEALDCIDDPQKYTRKKVWSELSELYQVNTFVLRPQSRAQWGFWD
ncbi:unnamed protein product [Dibothriocephalus latus]|uniref:Methyltransferase domain-containing protein n=1 Tax=Dibothriocephalus latus TaxID=60516 RepID=A0A3P7NU05_DIBLA|nr:unnamed protein product [Dibothriocephalus latus]